MNTMSVVEASSMSSGSVLTWQVKKKPLLKAGKMGILSCSGKHLLECLPEISWKAENVLKVHVTLKEEIEQKEQTWCVLITTSCI